MRNGNSQVAHPAESIHVMDATKLPIGVGSLPALALNR
jgi:hypothetical protein